MLASGSERPRLVNILPFAIAPCLRRHVIPEHVPDRQGSCSLLAIARCEIYFPIFDRFAKCSLLPQHLRTYIANMSGGGLTIYSLTVTALEGRQALANINFTLESCLLLPGATV